jgi:hypothetical protein
LKRESQSKKDRFPAWEQDQAIREEAAVSGQGRPASVTQEYEPFATEAPSLQESVVMRNAIKSLERRGVPHDHMEEVLNEKAPGPRPRVKALVAEAKADFETRQRKAVQMSDPITRDDPDYNRARRFITLGVQVGVNLAVEAGLEITACKAAAVDVAAFLIKWSRTRRRHQRQR